MHICDHLLSVFASFRDCYFGNGTCMHETCHCYDAQTGPQCQIRCSPEDSKALSALRKERDEEAADQQRILLELLQAEAESRDDSSARVENASILSARRKNQEDKGNRSEGQVEGHQGQSTSKGPTEGGNGGERRKIKGKLKMKPKPGAVRKVKPSPSSPSSRSKGDDALTDVPDMPTQRTRQLQDTQDKHRLDDVTPAGSAAINDENFGIDDRVQTVREGARGREIGKEGGRGEREETGKGEREIDVEAQRNTVHRSVKEQQQEQEQKQQQQQQQQELKQQQQQQQQQQKQLEVQQRQQQEQERHEEQEEHDERHERDERGGQEEQPEEPSVESLYGPGRRYPEPYLAGKPPNEMVHQRQQHKRDGKSFVYAVRFRMGPLGLSFDNRVGSVYSLCGCTCVCARVCVRVCVLLRPFPLAVLPYQCPYVPCKCCTKCRETSYITTIHLIINSSIHEYGVLLLIR